MRRRIVVIGATGRTGRLVADELAGHGPVLLVGRDAGALQDLRRRTGVEVAIAQLDDLGGVLIPGDVLLNLVGPHDLRARPVVRAAISSGATYLDIATEPAFLADLHDRRGEEARVAGTTLMPSVGARYLAGVLLGDQVLTAAGGAARAVEIAYLSDGGSVWGTAGARALARPTTTFAGGRHQREVVGARLGTFGAGGRGHATVSAGGAEVWALPARHPALERVDVHTGAFGALGPAASLAARVAGPTRSLRLDRVVGRALERVADVATSATSVLPGSGREATSSRFVARARDARGEVVARREAVGTSPVLLTARLAAATAEAVAEAAVADIPPGVVDPVTALGVEATTRIAEWAGVVTT